MPIRIPDHLPARQTLEQEGVMVMDSTRAARQDIRPLQIGLLNLMPNKERTETQFAPADRRYPAAGRPDAGARDRPPGQEHARGLPQELLFHLE
jgi:hypothetical protein